MKTCAIPYIDLKAATPSLKGKDVRLRSIRFIHTTMLALECLVAGIDPVLTQRPRHIALVQSTCLRIENVVCIGHQIVGKHGFGYVLPLRHNLVGRT